MLEISLRIRYLRHQLNYKEICWEQEKLTQVKNTYIKQKLKMTGPRTGPPENGATIWNKSQKATSKQHNQQDKKTGLMSSKLQRAYVGQIHDERRNNQTIIKLKL